MKKHWSILAVFAVLLILVLAFFLQNPNKTDETPLTPDEVSNTQYDKTDYPQLNTSSPVPSQDSQTDAYKEDTETKASEDSFNDVAEVNQIETPPSSDVPVSEGPVSSSFSCTFSISCANISSNMDSFDSEKLSLVPEDGLIYYGTITFEDGETVFDVLERVTCENGIHMEASFVPLTGSSYIEGINNLYEFDGGPLSGWMYSVNGYFPNYGCSSYVLKDGDEVQWVYTLDLGIDVGAGEFSSLQGL